MQAERAARYHGRTASQPEKPLLVPHFADTARKTSELHLRDLSMLAIGPLLRGLKRWWLRRAERHFMMCADVEQQRVHEAQLNVAYYHKRAALARSDQL